MNTLADTYDGLAARDAGCDPPRTRGLLRRLAALSAADREATRRFPDAEEIRLALHALGRGFDCM
jgi:hypothetical protein